MIYGTTKVSENATISGNARIRSGYFRSSALIKSDSDYLVFSPVGSENGTLTAYKTEDNIHVTRGCFTGTLEEFEEAVKETHGSNRYAKEYSILITFIKQRFKTN